MKKQPRDADNEHGFTMLETLFSVAILAILLLFIPPAIKELNSASQNGAFQLLAYIKTMRAQAISTTSAYTMSRAGDNSIIVTFGDTCNSVDQVSETQWTFTLPRGATFIDPPADPDAPGWPYCINQLGLGDQNFLVEIRDDRATRAIELQLGGAIEVR